MTNKTRLRPADRTEKRISKNYASKHGGRRTGAGRPEGIHTPIKPIEERRHPISVRLPYDMITWLQSRSESITVMIERAVNLLKGK